MHDGALSRAKASSSRWDFAEASAGVGHVVEADVHRDLVAFGVGEDQVGVHGAVEREGNAEDDQAGDDDDRGIEAGAEAWGIEDTRSQERRLSL